LAFHVLTNAGSGSRKLNKQELSEHVLVDYYLEGAYTSGIISEQVAN